MAVLSLTSLLALLLTWCAAIVTPGPDVIQIARVATKSRQAGTWCAIGIMVGNSGWIIASLLGLSALVAAVPGILVALQILGGAYLLYLGLSSMRSGWRGRGADAAPAPDDLGQAAGVHGDHGALSARRALLLGLGTNLSNPKALLFFGAIFAQFVSPGLSPIGAVIIAVMLIVTGFAWFVGFAQLVHRLAGPMLRNSSVVDLVAGVIFVVIAVVLLVEGLSGLSGLSGL